MSAGQFIQTIKTLAKELEERSDEQLQEEAASLQRNCKNGLPVDDLLTAAYALVYAACIRSMGITPYDVQILGALHLHHGKIIEMQTGEGKTLAAVFPAFLNALSGNGVHILTFNDYLAERDAKWMLPLYTLLGLSVGYINQTKSQAERKAAYACDITYSTAKNTGFDYLRSTLIYDKEEVILRPFNYAIIDEADAILIDEGRNPLVLSGEIKQTDIDFQGITDFVAEMELKTDFDTDDFKRNVFMTDAGIEKAEQNFELDNLFTDENLELLSAINLSLQARALLQKNVDYIIKEGHILLVDEFTGRIVHDRKWKDGLQMAVEAKEKVQLHPEGGLLTMITLPHFFEQYPKISGMTATARQSTDEFFSLYGFRAIKIPPNRENRRTDKPEQIYHTREEKYSALIGDVQERHEAGQPLLIGTLTVKESEEIAERLSSEGLQCKVLNAKNDAMEAAIISDAGRPGAITISTNMAGRGTDILLGGDRADEREKVLACGGLHVIGTNLHESSRIDHQLKGRAGRQGDIGSSRFYLSFEDELMIRYKLNKVIPKKLNAQVKNLKEKTRKYFRHIQRLIEGQMQDLRKMHFEYSAITEMQRRIIHERRETFLNPDYVAKRLRSLPGPQIKLDEIILLKARTIILYQHDYFWAQHLEYLSEIKEGMPLLRMGRKNPMREFQKHADANFSRMQVNIGQQLKRDLEYLLDHPETELEELGIQKPSSTWTYIINDFPFGNRFNINITGSSYLGF